MIRHTTTFIRTPDQNGNFQPFFPSSIPAPGNTDDKLAELGITLERTMSSDMTTLTIELEGEVENVGAFRNWRLSLTPDYESQRDSYLLTHNHSMTVTQTDLTTNETVLLYTL